MIQNFSKTDLKVVFRDLGTLLSFLSLGFIIPILISFVLGESGFNQAMFFLAGVSCLVFGRFLFFMGKVTQETNVQHVLVISCVSWGVFAIFAGLPFVLIQKATFSNAFFESMSALTTTGLSVFADPSVLPKSLLIWRSLLAWIGGMGAVLLAIIGVLFAYSKAGAFLKQSGRIERIRENFSHSLTQIAKTYVLLSLLGIALLLLFGMRWLDATNYALNAISSTGFESTNGGIAGFGSRWIEATVILLSILGATSFFVHYSAFNKRLGGAFGQDSQFKAMVLLGLISSVLLFPSMQQVASSARQAVEYSLFHAGSAVSNVGFTLLAPVSSTVWPDFSLMVIIVLTLIGGSAASTAGGLKIGRMIIAVRGMWKKISEKMRGKKSAASVRFEGREVTETEIAEVNQFIVLYIICVFVGAALLVFLGAPIQQALIEAVSAQSNAAFSSGLTSASLPVASKLVLSVLMWIGRLEIIPLFAAVGLLSLIHRQRGVKK